jgi:uncharacterized membrane protein YsdA (DUF1294 family)
MTISSALPLALALYILANGYAFFLYARDKRKAEKTLWRTSERALLATAVIGPFGAFGAMKLFRHKTRKITFYLVPVFLAIHIFFLIWIASLFL